MIRFSTTLHGPLFQSSFRQTFQILMGSREMIPKIMSWCSICGVLPTPWWKTLFIWDSFRTLTGMVAKWYIKLPQHSFVDFSLLETIFLTHFQLPIRYGTGMDLWTSLCQNTSMHISYHIHEWRRQIWLIKDPIPNQLLVDWFMKSLFPPISQDVSMGGVVTEEQAISHA